MSQRKAFTLVELLVVIGIIAVLIGILLPALSKAREQANAVKCMANMQQIGVGIQIYVAQHKGKMPMCWERFWNDPPNPAFADGGRGWTMFGALLTYSKIPMQIFRCPADTREYKVTEKQFVMPLISEITNPGVPEFSYAIMMLNYAHPKRRVPWSVSRTDSKITPNNGGLDAARIKRSSELMLVWDGVNAFFTSGQPAANVFYGTDSTTYAMYGITRHGGGPKKGPNCLYADGHVQMRIDWTPLKTTLGTKADDNFTLKWQ
jgi:prepilin-type N-terminal cleavage/methylation domain-containing protein/prepilin-type processing-associated H-X9-DG protein